MDEKGAPPTSPGYPEPPPADPGYPPQAPPPQPQAGYPPPQGQPGYPPQLQPQVQGYPQPQPQQPGYPPYPQQQAYPQQPYPQQGLTTDAPPPYYPPQPPAPQVGVQQQLHNVVLVQHQPQVVTAQVRQYGGGGDQGMALAIISTFVAIFFGCWFSLICSIPAIVFASNAQAAAASGEHELARQNRSYSTYLSVAGIVTGVAFYLAWIIAVIAIASS